MSGLSTFTPAVPPTSTVAGCAVWLIAGLSMWGLDGRVEIGSQALILVLAATFSALCWGFSPSLLASTAAVLAFNYSLVAPRGTLNVDVHQHVLLLLTMLVVSATVAALVARLRRAVALARAHARRSDELRVLGDHLRLSPDPEAAATALKPLLDAAAAAGQAAAILVDKAPDRVIEIGHPTAAEGEGLRAVMRDGRALGSGTDRFETVSGLYLPLRGTDRVAGAALIRLEPGASLSRVEQGQLQALCDLVGTAIERAAAENRARRAVETSQLQALRNTLLSAIAHDYRTPLATIVSAADSLLRQGDRLPPGQAERLALTILDEATQLNRITDNTLQLARLDALDTSIPMDWESPEELIGAVIARARQRQPEASVSASVAPSLGLIRCDAVLIVQLLENLLDNALKYAAGGGPITVFARDGRREGQAKAEGDTALTLGVEDQGPGIPPALRERIFERFARTTTTAPRPGAGLQPTRGVGVGLALCRAIARAHGGDLTVTDGRAGGACFSLTLARDPRPLGLDAGPRPPPPRPAE